MTAHLGAPPPEISFGFRSERAVKPRGTAGKQRCRVAGKVFERDGQKLVIRGATYGPFAPNFKGEPLPEPEVVARDFESMQKAGINAVRIYLPPSNWFLDLAEEMGMLIQIDVPCPKHLDFLESSATRRESRAQLEKILTAVRNRSCILSCSIGNEIPPDVVRWYGAKKIEHFLAELANVVRQADPRMLVTYGNYPPTEYLELPFLDFSTFNVYLHDIDPFRRYLLRLANKHFDHPLVLGEIGMDTLRNSEEHQAQFLSGHIRESLLLGLGGVFVFSWTDDWFTHGYRIEDWAFGITRREREPKPSYHAIESVFQPALAKQLNRTPRVSVVVCSYNGGKTLDQCLRSLEKLDYPNYEVILVDDGSQDDTPAIAERYPQVKTIRQANRGLSAARNVGLEAATGEIVAYTDSDCFADPDWLTLLVHRFIVSGAAGVGGPNLTPEDGWLAGCVACAPGQPTHVLESDEIAEHIPGCNMAFLRTALLETGGFDPQFRKAGDDVDLCWSLQEAGYRITFAPGAFVWHHRRQGARAYLKQQSGYGEAEAMLMRKHPDRFNALGGIKWRGMLYGGMLAGLRLGKPLIHGGTFGQGLFQTLYQPGPAHWLMLPASLEWHLFAGLMLCASFMGAPTFPLSMALFFASFLVAVMQAIQARPAKQHDGFISRCVISGLCWVQPLIRSAKRYKTYFGSPAGPKNSDRSHTAAFEMRNRQGIVRFITMDGIDRSLFLNRTIDLLRRRGWNVIVDSGWSDWDLEIACAPGMRLLVRSVQEGYPGNSAQIALRFRLKRKMMLPILGLFLIAASSVGFHGVQSGERVYRAAGLLATVAVCSLGLWFLRKGQRSARRVFAIFSETAEQLNVTRFEPLVAADHRSAAKFELSAETAQ